MNKRFYWIIREKTLMILFQIRKVIFKLDQSIKNFKYNISLDKIIFKKMFCGAFKSILIIYIMLNIDCYLISKHLMNSIDVSAFTNIVIGCLGIVGVILGLYCANIASIYSTKYSLAPKIILKAFQNDSLNQRCIGIIIDYIIYDFIVLVEILSDYKIGWITVTITIIRTMIVIISYGIVGRRAYQLSDVYNVLDDTYMNIYKIINSNLLNKIYKNDINIQNSFRKIMDNNIELLNAVQKFCSSRKDTDNLSLVDFMNKNLYIIQKYWGKKRKINKNSYWFEISRQYQKWHLANDTEASIALQTGTLLSPKNTHDYYWLEEKLFSINHDGIRYLCEKSDFESLINYCRCFKSLSKAAVNNEEFIYYIKEVNFLLKIVENVINEKKTETSFDKNKIFMALVEMLSTIYLSLIIEINNYIKSIDISKDSKNIIKILDKGKRDCIVGKEDSAFYDNIMIEKIVEGKRITPDWVISEEIAKKYFKDMKIMEEIITESINGIFSFGKRLVEGNKLYEASIVLIKFYEYESKVKNLISTANLKEKEILKYKKNKERKWANSKLKNIEKSIRIWKIEIPDLLVKCSGDFALKTWQHKDETPDFLGECYNHICEDTIESIIQNKKLQFHKNFENLVKLMLIYQEYIRSDFLDSKEPYRIEYMYYMITYPIVELAQVGGLAILWGEFNDDGYWLDDIKKATETLFEKGEDIADNMIEYVQKRNDFVWGIGGRDIIETGWKNKVENAIRENCNYETEYSRFSVVLKTKSKLLKAFCNNFESCGFGLDVSDIYWIKCINPKVKKEKRFHSRSSWEERMNDT